MTFLYTLMWSFCLHRLFTMKTTPAKSLKGELSHFFSYSLLFTVLVGIITLFVRIFV